MAIHEIDRGPDRMKTLLANLPKLDVTNIPCDLTTFTCFPKLALELQQKIWRYACFQERTIKLNYKFPFNETWDFGLETNKVEGQSKAPVVLAVCLESRNEGLRFYTLVPVTARIQTRKKIWRYKDKDSGPNQHGEQLIAGERPREFRRGIKLKNEIQKKPWYWKYDIEEVQENLYVNFHVDRFVHCSLAMYPQAKDVARARHNFEPDVLKKIKHFDILYSEIGLREYPISGMWGFFRQIDKLKTFNVLIDDFGCNEEHPEAHQESFTGHLYVKLKKAKMLNFMAWRISDPCPDPLCMQGTKLGVQFVGKDVVVDLAPCAPLNFQSELSGQSSFSRRTRVVCWAAGI